MPAGHLKEIFIVGSHEAIEGLLERLINEVNRTMGLGTIIENSHGLTVKWTAKLEFAIDHQKDGLYLRAPAIITSVERAQIWNKSIEEFYREIVEPIADTTGGLTSKLYDVARDF